MEIWNFENRFTTGRTQIMAQIPYMNWMGNQPTGSAYDVYQYYLGGGSPGGTSTPTSGGGGGITSLPWYQQTGGGGNGGPSGLGGRYGNLDLSKTKTFNKDVWEVGGPANQYGSWVDKEVKGYYDPTQGNWKTFEGKNINHAGINIQPMFASLLGLDKKGPKPGDIKGTFRASAIKSIPPVSGLGIIPFSFNSCSCFCSCFIFFSLD